ncbi:MAG: OmpH family outer membrane protein [Bacteroidales bacterium]
MKRVIILIFVMAVIAPASSVLAQNDLKFGHVNIDQVMSMMPERDSAREELEQYNQMLQQEMQVMQQEYTDKLQKYQENVDSYSRSGRQSREEELQDMQRRIQEFQTTAQEDFQQKQAEVLEPIINRIENAIKKVGEREGFIYIFDTSANTVVYKSDQSVDVTQMVQEELGVQQ